MKKKAKVFKKPRNLKMSEQSEKALDKSIEHWFRVRDNNERACADECTLCVLYYDSRCRSCPVFKRTRKAYCNNTPYYKYDEALEEDGDEDERKRLAQAEIEFLQSCYY